MKIGLIGAGRLGLCLALLIEDTGYDVLASDIRPDYVNDLNEKKYRVISERIIKNLPIIDDWLDEKFIKKMCVVGIMKKKYYFCLFSSMWLPKIKKNI